MHFVWNIVSLLTGGRVTTKLSPRDKVLFLTFDDGPHADNTVGLMRLLEQHGARATFFLVGSKVSAQRDVLKALLERGHILANHSHSHRRLTTLSTGEMRNELRLADAALTEVDGERFHLFRPPWGQISVRQLLDCVFSGRRIFLWSRDSYDYRKSAADIVEHFRDSPPASGDILLFHDDGPTAENALKALLPEWRKQGFRFEALPTG